MLNLGHSYTLRNFEWHQSSETEVRHVGDPLGRVHSQAKQSLMEKGTKRWVLSEPWLLNDCCTASSELAGKEYFRRKSLILGGPSRTLTAWAGFV